MFVIIFKSNSRAKVYETVKYVEYYLDHPLWKLLVKKTSKLCICTDNWKCILICNTLYRFSKRFFNVLIFINPQAFNYKLSTVNFVSVHQLLTTKECYFLISSYHITNFLEHVPVQMETKFEDIIIHCKFKIQIIHCLHVMKHTCEFLHTLLHFKA